VVVVAGVVVVVGVVAVVAGSAVVVNLQVEGGDNALGGIVLEG